jgi:hypothetical protein
MARVIFTDFSFFIFIFHCFHDSLLLLLLLLARLPNFAFGLRLDGHVGTRDGHHQYEQPVEDIPHILEPTKIFNGHREDCADRSARHVDVKRNGSKLRERHCRNEHNGTVEQERVHQCFVHSETS